MQVFEAMTPDVISVAPEATLMEAARTMKTLDVGPLPVCVGNQLARLRVRAAGAQHHDRVLALALVLNVGDLGDHRQLSRGRQRRVQPDTLRSV